MVAKVMCSGTCDKASVKYQYDGITDCVAVYRFGGGEKTCLYGCTGYGSCVRACMFDAISIVNGVAHVDPDTCKSCGMCIETCPDVYKRQGVKGAKDWDREMSTARKNLDWEQMFALAIDGKNARRYREESTPEHSCLLYTSSGAELWKKYMESIRKSK